MKKQYWECPLCHSHLDYGERCDCKYKEQMKQEDVEKLLVKESDSNQLTFNWNKNRVGA